MDCVGAEGETQVASVVRSGGGSRRIHKPALLVLLKDLGYGGG